MTEATTWLPQVRIYTDRRILSVFLFGILSGLPWVMIGSALTLWLKESDISRTDIGYAGFIFSVYAINFLWAPLLDRYSLRLLPGIGKRRSWILLCQLVIILGCWGIGNYTPTTDAKAVVLVALLIAIASATQDIAIDAYRVDQFEPEEAQHISAAAAMSTAGWWTGYAGFGYFSIMLSDYNWSWPESYLLLGGITCILTLVSLFFCPDPKSSDQSEARLQLQDTISHVAYLNRHVQWLLVAWLCAPLTIVAWSVLGSPGLGADVTSHPGYVPMLAAVVVALLFSALIQLSRMENVAVRQTIRYHHSWATSLIAFILSTIIAPIREFFSRNGFKFALNLLLFIFLFKVGEAILGRMSVVFYKEIGYSNTDIANYSKMLTWWVTILAAIPCGLLNAKLGLIRGLFISGICMSASNLMFAAIAIIGPDINWYIATVIVDGITSAWSAVAFVAFISMLCSHRFSATQYALMASLASVGKNTLASFSGQIVDALDGNWAIFFSATAFMVIPSLCILRTLRSDLRERYHQNS